MAFDGIFASRIDAAASKHELSRVGNMFGVPTSMVADGCVSWFGLVGSDSKHERRAMHVERRDSPGTHRELGTGG
jgi:hypothetical protein